jgi:hypothetical protein
MWRRAWLGWVVVAGCSLDPVRTSAPYEAPPEPAFRGPGVWIPAEGTRAAPVAVVLQRSGVVASTDALASFEGERVLFTQGGNLCSADADTGAMETDVGTGDDSGDTGRVGGTWTGPGEQTLAGSGPGDEVLVVRDGRVRRVTLPAGEVAGVEVGDDVLDARIVAGGVAAVRGDGTVAFEGGAVVPLPGPVVSGFSLAVDGDALLVATADAVVRVDRAGAAVVAGGAEHVAVDRASGALARASTHGVAGDGWHWRADGEIRGLTSVGAAGVFAAWVDVGSDDRIELLDAATGEPLGTLDVRDGLRGFDGSAGGNLLLQVRGDEAVSWRLVR